jgi:uncharacterized membrane protein YedE/YeeE
MDPVLIVVIPGLIGGLVIGLLVIFLNRNRRGSLTAEEFRDGTSSSDVINAARIRVAGIGGLGLVAMAAAVAVFVPRIRFSLALGAGLGCVLAAILIAWRRRGPMPSSGQRLGANTTLAIDLPADDDHNRTPRGDAQPLERASHCVSA